MSLHAQLSPEALQRLRSQQRNSTISSIIVSILVLVLIGLILGLFLLPHIEKEPDVIVSYKFNEPQDEVVEKTPKETVQKKPSSPSSSIAKVITSAAVADVAVPVPEVSFSPPSVDFGESSDFGSGFGSGTSGSGFSSLPSTMGKRCSKADRMKRLKESGGVAASETAVVKALQWLKATQNEDGSWTGDGKGKDYPVGMTGMAILAYLGHCETPKSSEYGQSITKGIMYLLDNALKNDGYMHSKVGHSSVYEHGIATYALAETYTFCKDLKILGQFPKLKQVTEKAGDMIMEGQSPAGGWNYTFGQANTGDNSVGFWMIQALKACKHTGLWADKKFDRPFENAVQFLEKVQGNDGAIGYRESSTRSPGLTGGGVLCLQFMGQGDSKAALKGIEYVRENTKFDWKDKKAANLYYHYYNAQAMINAGGEHWDWYNDLYRDQLLEHQDEDGSWNKTMGHGPINRHMSTCLATFMLQVYYRFLPGTNK